MNQKENDKEQIQGFDYRFASFIYKWRWPLSLVVLFLIVGTLVTGVGRIGQVTSSIIKIGDISNGSGAIEPQVFDPSLDVWFPADDEAVDTYYEIEDRFIAEDYVMVAFEVKDNEYGAFSRQSLSTIARLTERFLTIPGVRHVRSLTYNPWIRWGTIEDDSGSESGLIISDLVEGDPKDLTNHQIIERMVAVLGARRTAEKIGESRVRAVLGANVDFDNHIGEPLLLDAIIDETGTTTAIQIQVVRPKIDRETLASVVQDKTDEHELALTSNLYAVQYQRAALRGIEHFLRLEAGLAKRTPEYSKLAAWVNAMPEGAEKAAGLLALKDPTKNFMQDGSGNLIRKYFEYDKSPAGGYVDSSDPASPVEAPAGFQPKSLSPYIYHLGGIPAFERNFEISGKADAKYLPLMFLVIAVGLLIVFRSVAGLVVPMVVVFASIMGMVGSIFIVGKLFNNLTAMSPNMLTAIAIADAVHLVAAWSALRTRFDNKKDLIIEVLRKNALPVFLTSVTTAVGFYSLLLSQQQPVRDLAVAMGFGTLIAYVLSMTLVPLLLSFFPHKRKKAKTIKTGLVGFFTRERSEKMASNIVRFRKPIVVVSCIVTVVALVGLFRVQINADIRNMFPDDNKVMVDLKWIENHLGGVGDLEIVFNGVQGSQDAQELTMKETERLAELHLNKIGAEKGVPGFQSLTSLEEKELARLQSKESSWNASRIGVSPEFLMLVEGFEARLRQEMSNPNSPLRFITDLTSPLDILRKIHQVQNENKASFYRVVRESDVPEHARQEVLAFDDITEEWSFTPRQDASTLAAQYYLQYESGARPGENLATQLSLDRKHFRMQGRVLLRSTLEKEAIFGRIQEIAKREFPKLTVQAGTSEAISDMAVSGKQTLLDRAGMVIAIGFTKSITVALLVITLLIGLIFRSVRLALVSLLPNVFPIFLPLSVFGLLGIILDGPAIVVTSVALGVCVDDTIHFFTKYVQATKQGKSSQEAIAYVFQESGGALTITTLILVIGFSTLLLSSFSPNFLMGALATIMITLAWFADFIVTPAVLTITARDGKSKGISHNKAMKPRETIQADRL
ncbi:MAG: hypothetical protein E2O79_09330 [Caldithrix sp.]|nr:MAG: hypothetical protein E2O79_09330 [Caldithrix sp.]